jgi:hypothetical protein
LPDLSKHFETLDITPDLFLIDWMLTLYSKLLDLELVSRIWDNFLLDGEIFAIKVAIGLLMYLEKDLMNQSYNRIIKLLRGPNVQNNIHSSLYPMIDTPTSKKEISSSDNDTYHLFEIDELQLFRFIDDIEIDKNEYYSDLKMQKWSYQKSKILTGVFK